MKETGIIEVNNALLNVISPVILKFERNYCLLGENKARTYAVVKYPPNPSMGWLAQITDIYGHNMGAGRQDMFGSLLSYKDSEYYLAHRYIQFDTIYQRHGWWKLFAVIEHDIRSQKFQYMRLWFDSTDDFAGWIATVKELSIYDSDMDITPQDHILTLSTCDKSKYGRDGRLLIMAIKMNEIELTSGQVGPK